MAPGQAISTGIFAGIFEALFERVSIGNFKSFRSSLSGGGPDIAKNVVKSMAVNASEEAATELANITYDTIMSGDFSRYETTIRQYMAAGMSESESKTEAAKVLGQQLSEAAVSGALVGLGLVGIGAVTDYRNLADVGKALKADGTNAGMIALGQAPDEGSQAQALTASSIKAVEPTLDELTAAFQAGLDGKRYTPDTAAEVTSLQVAELMEVFKAGLEGRKYEPKAQQPSASDATVPIAPSVENLQSEQSAPEDAQDFHATDTNTDDLLEVFKAGLEGKRYVPNHQKNTFESQSVPNTAKLDNNVVSEYTQSNQENITEPSAKEAHEKKRHQLAINHKQGREFEQRSFAKLSSIYQGKTVEQLTIKTSTGRVLRLDGVAYDDQGEFWIIQEYKSSQKALLSKNQRKGFEELKKGGGTIVSRKYSDGYFQYGTSIPPTTVEIIRPEK